MKFIKIVYIEENMRYYINRGLCKFSKQIIINANKGRV